MLLSHHFSPGSINVYLPRTAVVTARGQLSDNDGNSSVFSSQEKFFLETLDKGLEFN